MSGTPTIDRIQERGTLLVGTTGEYRPLSYREPEIDLSETYRKAGDAIHDAIKASILKADGFVNCSNNRFDKKDMLALVYDSKKGYTESFPIRAMRVGSRILHPNES